MLTRRNVDPRLFRLPGVRAGALGITALFFALFGLYYVNAQYLQDVKGYSPLLTGVCILPIAALMPFISARSPQLAARVGARVTIILGMLILAAGLVLLSFATAATPYPLYGLLLAVIGGGMGLAMPPLSGMIVHALPPSHAGVSSGLASTTREIGSALGVAVLSTVLTTRFASHLPAALQHVRAPRARRSGTRLPPPSTTRPPPRVPASAGTSSAPPATHSPAAPASGCGWGRPCS